MSLLFQLFGVIMVVVGFVYSVLSIKVWRVGTGIEGLVLLVPSLVALALGLLILYVMFLG